MPTRLTRQHFRAIADALYSTRPTAGVFSRLCQDGTAVAWSQWRATRDALAREMRRFNPNFNRSTFDEWTEEGDPAYRPKPVTEWTVQGNYGHGHGWEDLTSGTDYREMRAELATYRREEPTAQHRINRATVRT